MFLRVKDKIVNNGRITCLFNSRCVVIAFCIFPLLFNLPRFFDQYMEYYVVKVNGSFTCETIRAMECCMDKINVEGES